MKKDIIKILKKADFEKEFIKYVEREFSDIYKKRFKRPYEKDFKDNILLGLNAKDRLTESLVDLIPLKDYYKKKKIPLIYFYKSIGDLSYRVERFYKEKGVYGLSDWDIKWLSNLYRGKIFDIGSLRYEISKFSFKEIEREGYQYMELYKKYKDKFQEGEKIITIHILNDSDFSPKNIDESFMMAREFFGKYFKDHDYKFFICRTWLLYQPMWDILSKESNIKSFSKRFKIIGENQNSKQALDRIYGTSSLKEIKNMDKKTSLEKKAYKNQDKLGVAAGIIYKYKYK